MKIQSLAKKIISFSISVCIILSIGYIAFNNSRKHLSVFELNSAIRNATNSEISYENDDIIIVDSQGKYDNQKVQNTEDLELIHEKTETTVDAEVSKNKADMLETNSNIILLSQNSKITKSGSCGKSVNWAISGSTLKITGSGEMDSWSRGCDETFPGWYDSRSTITSISIGGNVTTIGNYAFADFVNLRTITISKKIKSVGSYSFNNCNNLTKLTLNTSVKLSIQSNAFDGCGNLVSIDVKNSNVCLIDNEAFKNCSNLRKLSLPGSKLKIGNSAFENCSNITTLVMGNIKSIGESAFRNCENIRNLKFNGSSLVSIGNSAFENDSAISNLVLPSGLTSIGDSAFKGCTGINSITFGKNIKSIGNSAFEGLIKLKKANLNSKLKTIGSYSFKNCTSLSTVTLPASLKSIGSEAFYGDSKIGKIIIGNNVTSIGESAFMDCAGLKTVTIGKKLTELQCRVFKDCVSLTDITIPGNISKINEEAFSGNIKLKKVTLKSGIVNIGNSAFKGCSSLKALTLPNTVVSLGGDCFYGCTSLKSVTMGNSLTTIENGAFANNESLEKLSFGININKICYEAFRNCSSLTEVNIPNHILDIGSHVFDSCSSLKTVRIGNSLQNIGYGAFANCDMLNSIIIYSKTVSFDDEVFHSGKELKVYGYKNSTVEQYAKNNQNTFVTVTQKALKQSWFNLGENTVFEWSGKYYSPKVYNTNNLIEGIDYDVVYDYKSNVGKHLIEIYGNNACYGELTLDYKIIKAPQTISAKNLKKQFTTAKIKSIAKLTFGDGKLSYKSSKPSVATVNSNGTVTIKKLGTAKITITASATKNCNKTIKTITLKIIKASPIIKGVANSYVKTYNPAATSFSLKAKTSGNGKITYSSSNKKILIVDKKTGKVTVKGTGSARITIRSSATAQCNAAKKIVNFTIKKAPASNFVISGIISSRRYTGKALKQSITVTYNKKQLKKGKDYTVSYSNNKKRGKATMIIKGKGKYCGKTYRYFSIY